MYEFLEVGFIALIKDWPQEKLVKEVLRLQDLAALALPREGNLPKLSNIDYFAVIEPYEGCVGGDILVIVNFSLKIFVLNIFAVIHVLR